MFSLKGKCRKGLRKDRWLKGSNNNNNDKNDVNDEKMDKCRKTKSFDEVGFRKDVLIAKSLRSDEEILNLANRRKLMSEVLLQVLDMSHMTVTKKESANLTGFGSWHELILERERRCRKDEINRRYCRCFCFSR